MSDQAGLMEKRDIPSEKPYRSEFETRKTTLFDRFLQFEFDDAQRFVAYRHLVSDPWI